MTTADQIAASLKDDQIVIELNSKELRETDDSYEAFLMRIFGTEEMGKAFAQFAKEHAEPTLAHCLAQGDNPVTCVGVAMFQGLAIGYRYGRDHVKESDLPL